MCNFTYFIKLKGVVTHFQDILNMLKCHKREVEKMLQQERHEQILARLNTEGKVKVKNSQMISKSQKIAFVKI